MSDDIFDSNSCNSNSDTLQERLQRLGDPSGRQDSQYWDEWFSIVNQRNNKSDDNNASDTNQKSVLPFEWYCSVEEVMRVISFHLSDGVAIEENDGVSNSFSVIHPGSGTSLLPFELQQKYNNSQQVVVDISDVALEGIKSTIANNANNKRDNCSDDNDRDGATRHADRVNERIEYLKADVINESLPFDDSSFMAWIDKGFVDAVFAKDNDNAVLEQSCRMFKEAHRVLHNNNGTLIIVSLAEDHSLQIILDGYKFCSWKTDMHVWELRPTSGDLRPLAFVFTKTSDQAEGKNASKVCINWHHNDDKIETTTCQLHELQTMVEDLVSTARKRYKESLQHSKRMTLLTLEIKPYDVETDLVCLAKLLQSESFNFSNNNASHPLCPNWQPFDNGNMYEIVPIGFGIQKLIMKCVCPSDYIDDLVSSIESWEGTEGFEECIQSVDVDWSNTFPIQSVYSPIHNNVSNKS